MLLFFFFFFFFLMIRRPPRSTLFPTRRSSDLGDWEESQDLTQDTFVQALKAIDAARAKSGTQFQAKARSEEHTSELQSRRDLVCRLLLEKKKKKKKNHKEYNKKNY